MELRFQAGGPESWSADAVIVFLSEDEKLEKAYPELLDAAPWMSIAPGMRDFHGEKKAKWASSTARPHTLCPARRGRPRQTRRADVCGNA